MSSGANGVPPLPSSPPTAANRPASSSASCPPLFDNAFYRYATLLAIKVLKRIRPRDGNVLMLTESLCVKYGPLVQLSEASAMRFISTHTSIPVPKIYCAFTHCGWNYIVMERIKGEYIGRGWVRRTEESKAKLLSQLSEMVLEMRRLPPPDGVGVASADGGPLYDCRVPGPSLRHGPFSTIQDFHRHLRMGLEYDDELQPDVQTLIKQQDQSWPLLFTHGDLSSLNILARGDEIVGIVDWETAGWYPAYWEYTSACQVNPQNSFWIHEIDKFLQPWPEELAMERIRWERFGNF